MTHTTHFNKLLPYLVLSPLFSVFVLLLPLKHGMDITVACCFISFLTTITFYRTHIKWNRYKTIFLCYLLFGIYLEIWGANTYKSGELRTLIYVAFFIFTVPTKIINKKLIKVLVIVSIVLLFIQGFYSHHFIGTTRVEGHITNPVHYATICATLSLLLFIFIISEPNPKYQAGLTILFIASLLTLIYTGSRGPWIAFLGGFLAISFLGFKLLRKNLGFPILIIGIVSTCIMLPAGYKTLKTRSDSVQNEYISYQQQNYYDSSTGARLHLYKNAMYTIARDNFMGMKVPYKENLENLSNIGVYKAKTRFGHFHNSYLDRLAKFGILGLLLLLAFVLYPFGTALKTNKTDRAFFLIAFTPPCVFLLAALTAVSFRSEESLLFFVMVNYLAFLLNPDLPEDQLVQIDLLEQH